MADALYVLLRILHVGSAVFFIGGATLWGAVIAPALVELGPTLPKGALPTLGKKVLTVLPHAGVATLLTGIAVFWSLGGFGEAGRTTWGMLVGLGLLLTLAMVVVLFAVIKPTFRRLGQVVMATPGPPPPEAKAMLGKLMAVGRVNLALGWLVVLLMVLATSHAL